MSLNIYENTLRKLNRSKVKLISGVLATTMLFTLSGCNKEDKKTDSISINIVDEMYEDKNGEYEYILNLEAIKVNPLNKFSLLKEVEAEIAGESPMYADTEFVESDAFQVVGDHEVEG